ncbi:MAG TPA: secretin N-terminal domain-containing protein [Gemmatimonadales bacterium]|jgi:type IV pilus assembly protein PilQ|nr:secretin N-terminal domain-containing protein [Gemmatimonadales bacterium]
MMMRPLSFLLVPLLAGPAAAPRAPHAGPQAQVTALTLSSANGTARFSIAVTGTVTAHEMVLHDPERLVLDLSSAIKGDLGTYDGLRRGIVHDVRVNQYRDSVVRVVLEVDRLPSYTVDRATPGAVTVTFADQPYSSWASAGSRSGTIAAPVDQAVETVATTAADAGYTSAAAPVRSLTALDQAQQQSLLSFTFDNTSITDALNQFAQYSGRSIVPGKDVSGNVTMTITNANWDDAFHAFLDAEGLSQTVLPGGIIRVDAPGALAKVDSLEILEPAQVRLNYAKAADVANAVQGLVTKGRGSAKADTSTNSLILNDTRTRINFLVNFVKGLDIKTPTVSISAKLIFVDRTELEQLGVKYDIGTPQQFFNTVLPRTNPLTGQPYDPTINPAVVNLGGNAVAAVSNADALISGSALDLVFSTAIGGFSISSFLSALSQTELTDVEAQPTIETLDNKQAQIISGEQTPVRVIDAASLGTGAPRANVQFKETGIKLIATPHVTANRQIVLDLEVERSSVQPLASADLGFDIPIQHSINKMLVNDGETATIGGLIVTTVTKNRQGIPLLNNLPFIGSLFSYTTNQEHRQDLVIMVTPRIVDDPTSN